MELIADILLVAGALGAGLYCFVLSRRLKRFTDLEKGVGGAVAVLSTQAEELKKSLGSAREASDRSGAALKDLTERAESVAQRLELMMASMHDVISEDVAEPGPQRTDSKAEPEPVVDDNPPIADAPSVADAPEQEAAKTPENKRPGGLMFFRHDRNRSEAAT